MDYIKLIKLLTYIDLLLNHLNDTKWVPKYQERHCFLTQSIKISVNK